MSVLSDKQAAKLMYAIDSMDEYYRREILGIPSRIRVKKILDELGNIKNKKILDVGCEAGYITLQLAEKGAWVTGVDLITEPLEKFKEILTIKPKGVQKRIKVQKADARKLPFKKHQFDYVVAAEVIEHIRQLSGFVNGAWRALKPEGRLLLTFPHESLRRRFYPLLPLFGVNANIESQVTLKEYSPEKIKEIFSKKFILIKKYRLPWRLPITNLMIFKPKRLKK